MPSWFPGAGLKKEARKWRPFVKDFVDAPFAETEAAVVSINFFNCSLGFTMGLTEKWKRSFLCRSSSN
jgi:hypothetical protein